MHHRLTQLAAAAALMLVTASALAGRIEDIKARGYVRIGVSLGGEPVGFRNAGNEPVGYDVDVARQLAAKLGVPARFSDVSSDARISMLRSGSSIWSWQMYRSRRSAHAWSTFPCPTTWPDCA